MTVRTAGLLLFFHHVRGIYPVIYMSKRRMRKRATHQLPSHATHARNITDTMAKRIQRLGFTALMRSLNVG